MCFLAFDSAMHCLRLALFFYAFFNFAVFSTSCWSVTHASMWWKNKNKFHNLEIMRIYKDTYGSKEPI